MSFSDDFVWGAAAASYQSAAWYAEVAASNGAALDQSPH